MKLNFNYWNTTVGVIGKSRTGKTYITGQLAKRADGRCSVLCALESNRVKYMPFSKDIVIPAQDQIDGIVDRFIQDRAKNRASLLVFDDLDYFIHDARQSSMLMNLPVASKGEWMHGNIWQSRRLVNLPRPLVQNSDYLIFAFGVDPYDFDDLEKYVNFNPDIYKTMKPPVYSPNDPRVLLSAQYMLLDTQSGEQEIIDGVQ